MLKGKTQSFIKFFLFILPINSIKYRIFCIRLVLDENEDDFIGLKSSKIEAKITNGGKFYVNFSIWSQKSRH
jgi:hypothetical protein